MVETFVVQLQTLRRCTLLVEDDTKLMSWYPWHISAVPGADCKNAGDFGMSWKRPDSYASYLALRGRPCFYLQFKMLLYSKGGSSRGRRLELVTRIWEGDTCLQKKTDAKRQPAQRPSRTLLSRTGAFRLLQGLQLDVKAVQSLDARLQSRLVNRGCDSLGPTPS